MKNQIRYIIKIQHKVLLIEILKSKSLSIAQIEIPPVNENASEVGLFYFPIYKFIIYLFYIKRIQIIIRYK